MPTLETTAQELLNSRVRGLRPSSTLAINEKCARLKEQGRTIYQLGFGQSPFTVPKPVVAALRANAFQRDYLPVKGLRELRAAVASYHRRKESISATEDDVLIGPGTKELMFLLQLTFNGDLLIPSPSWVSYEPQATLVGKRVCLIETTNEDGWRLLPDRLEQLCLEDPAPARLLILKYPNNPTGLTYRDDELKALATVARRYEIVILADEIYAELDHSASHASIARYYPERTIISSGLSKWCGAGGWRLGWFWFPSALRWLVEAMSVVASETFSAVSAPIQYAAVQAMHGGEAMDRYLTQSRRILRALGRHVSEQLRGAGVQVHSPQGAFYLFPDFAPHRESLRARGIVTSADLTERLLDETGVATLPGSDFGRPPEELTCRIAYVNFNGSACLPAANNVPEDQELSVEFLAKHCAGVLEAFEIIGDWLK